MILVLVLSLVWLCTHTLIICWHHVLSVLSPFTSCVVQLVLVLMLVLLFLMHACPQATATDETAPTFMPAQMDTIAAPDLDTPPAVGSPLPCRSTTYVVSTRCCPAYQAHDLPTGVCLHQRTCVSTMSHELLCP
jgi:hypothetical protein